MRWFWGQQGIHFGPFEVYSVSRRSVHALDARWYVAFNWVMSTISRRCHGSNRRTVDKFESLAAGWDDNLLAARGITARGKSGISFQQRGNLIDVWIQWKLAWLLTCWWIRLMQKQNGSEQSIRQTISVYVDSNSYRVAIRCSIL